MATARDVANYFLLQQEDESGDTISNLKLQKLVYYAQGFHLAIYGEPLFEDRVEAWTHGPVVPNLYHQFNRYGSGSIPQPDDFDINSLTEDEREFLDEVYDVYGQFSGWKLRNMTHEEPPWRDADTGGVITYESMRNYFQTLIDE